MEANVGKRLLLWLIIWLALMDLILLAVAGDGFDKYVDGTLEGFNDATFTVLILALVSGLVLVSAILAGLSHVHHYNPGSVGSATTTALIAWALMMLTFGVACKEIDIGGTKSLVQAVEAFVFLLTLFETIYVGIIFGGLFHPSLGVGYTA
ncbi:unnamed protein product [Calypogeia fissa]